MARTPPSLLPPTPQPKSDGVSKSLVIPPTNLTPDLPHHIIPNTPTITLATKPNPQTDGPNDNRLPTDDHNCTPSSDFDLQQTNLTFSKPISPSHLYINALANTLTPPDSLLSTTPSGSLIHLTDHSNTLFEAKTPHYGHLYCSSRSKGRSLRSHCPFCLTYSWSKSIGAYIWNESLSNMSHTHPILPRASKFDGRYHVRLVDDLTSAELSYVHNQVLCRIHVPKMQINLEHEFPDRSYESRILYNMRNRLLDKTSVEIAQPYPHSS